jgi:TolB-like protein
LLLFNKLRHNLMIFIRYITLSIILLNAIIAQDNRPSVAVLDFDAKGIPAYEAETLTERLRSEIANTNAVRLTDRKLLEKILQEQGLQQSGCTTDECAAEVGQLLGAQFIISGSIGKLGSSFTIDAKMVSVTTGAAERAKTATYKGDIVGLILEMEILAWEIVGLKAPRRLLAKRGDEDEDIENKVTLAVLDFEPRGISSLESQTLTDRFSTEINKTGKAILVDRNSMSEIMQEQGYTEAECSSEECAAEVGAMLGVQFMINGAIGKLGDTYTIDAKMFSVQTGAAEKTINTTYSGKVDGLITEIEILAWEIMNLKPPKSLLKKRKGGSAQVADVPRDKSRFGAMMRSMLVPGWGQLYSDRKLVGWSILGGELAIGALAFSAYSSYSTANSDLVAFNEQYNNSSDPLQIADLRSKTLQAEADQISSNDQMTTLIYAAGGLWAINVVHAFLMGPKAETASRKSGFDLVYHPEMFQPQLRFSIALD